MTTTTTQRSTTRMAPAPADQVLAQLGLPTPDEPSSDEALSHLSGGTVPNVLGILGNYPELMSVTNPLLTLLGTGVLPLRDRELAVLRTAYHLRSTYQWAHHVAIGAHAGITDDEIARVPLGPDAAGWSEHDAALLRAADELHGPSSRLSDHTWQQLSATYHDRQLLELLSVIGAYTMLGYLLNSCDAALEDGFTDPAPLPQV